MIDFTIKTLDSRDHRFSVEDGITVQQLKEKVLEQMGIEIGLQRLIFCGRVLQDEKKLAEYAVHGKVVHMVQRAPPGLESQQAIALHDREREREREAAIRNHSAAVAAEPVGISPVNLNNATQQQIRRLMSMAATAHGIEIEEQPGPILTPTASRLEFLRHIITEIRTNLDALRANETDEPPTYSTDDPLEEALREPPYGIHPTEVTCPIHDRPLLYQINRGLGASRSGRSRRIRSMRFTGHTAPDTLGLLVEQLHELDGEFAPFRQIYIDVLRDAGDPQVTVPEELLQRRQVTADLCAELFHSFSHAYHTVSDIGILLAHTNTRLTSDALMRHPLPVHAQFNVVQSPTRRPQSATSTSAGTSSDAGQEPSNALAGRINTTQPTVNVNIQPDPVTYQVEIETAVNIENVFMNGTNTSQGGPNQSQQQQSQNDSAQQDQEDLDDRRQVMIEFENLFRGLGQAGSLGGVEVVMSMEEIPQVATGANNNSGSTNVFQPAERGGNASRSVLGSQMYLAQTADLLHNIVASVFRQGLVPGMEGVVHAAVQQVQGQSPNQGQGESQSQARNQSQGESQSQPRNQGQSQPQPQPQPQTQSQAENQPQAQNQSQAPNLTPTQERSQENRTNTEQNANANSANANQPRQLPSGRSSRVHTLSIFNLVYDRFLQCDSLHARVQLQRRRDESVAAGGPTLHDNELNRVRNIVETLYDRFDREVIDEESLMIAFHLSLREACSFNSGRILQANEVQPLRRRLQVYMRQMMQGEYTPGTQAQLTDMIFQHHSVFVDRMMTITPMREHIDVITSMKNVFIRFMDEAMFVLALEDLELFMRQFRIVYPRLFYELCGVIAYCSLEGIEGLKRIYRSFMAEMIQNLDEPVRDLIHSITVENLNAALIRVEQKKIHYADFVRRRDQPSGSSSQMDPPPLPENRGYGDLLRTGNSKKAEEALEKKYVDIEVTDDFDDTNDADDIDESEDSKEPEETEQQTDSSTELEPQVEAMQVSSITLAGEPKDESVDENKESETRGSTPEIRSSATGAIRRDPGRLSRDRVNAEIKAAFLKAKDETEKKTRGRYREDAPQDHTAEERRQVKPSAPDPDDDDDLDWPGPPPEIATEDNRDQSRPTIRRPAVSESEYLELSSNPIPSGPLNGLIISRGRPSTIRQRSGRQSGPLNPPDFSDDVLLVPPAQIAQHWGESWGPTITRDLQRQRAATADEPYSDAYLTGMPPKKRRCVRQSRPPTTLNAFITEGVNAVSGSLDGVQAEELRATVREHVRTLSRSRAAASPDYEPRRFAGTARFLSQSRKLARRSPENSKPAARRSPENSNE